VWESWHLFPEPVVKGDLLRRKISKKEEGVLFHQREGTGENFGTPTKKKTDLLLKMKESLGPGRAEEEKPSSNHQREEQRGWGGGECRRLWKKIQND